MGDGIHPPNPPLYVRGLTLAQTMNQKHIMLSPKQQRCDELQLILAKTMNQKHVVLKSLI